MAETLIQTESLRREFGALVAVDDVSVAIRPGTLHAVIGPNGAGKTTLFNVLTRFQSYDSGHIYYEGQRNDSLLGSAQFKFASPNRL